MTKSNVSTNSECPCDNTITVFGTGDVSATPNIATIITGATTTSKQVTEAQEENAEIIATIVSSLRSIGIPTESIQTSDYRIEENVRYEDNTKVFLGYKVTHLLKVTVEPVKKAGAVIDVAVDSGANVVSDIRFEIKNPDIYYQEALRAAIGKANQKAQTIAQSLHLSLPKTPHRIIETGSEAPSPRMFSEVQSTQIQPGELSISAYVTLIFLLTS
ncbi:SIMPL domain-containing protein [Guptibacillus hwajinpoensis]|uniref:SIMPL domain-containing protein n=1 Tax=Guptibacillus hwajinpoensis TaxID=208199 RepID=UPI001CFC4AA0|nr:SIMPL domain-containing protein [Pseudalkalibacillus hwajinpoensis]WLR60109.1 SIMPL domain-containing protein [Pseudalkalibacillus hwajinpoensis]